MVGGSGRNDDRLVEAERAQRRLIRRARRTTCRCPDAVLNLGAVVALHAIHGSYLRDHNRFLEESVLEDLVSEYRKLAEDLELLESLLSSSAASPDIGPLATALLGRISDLLERERRIFYQPLLRLARGDDLDPTPLAP